ncbi:uncharacterized protein LOC110093772 [Dendrobium catenatum]|uniref:uncharacterized protein LOC110093772 n=1 Tax=Dendrobium catenatum TaxID=906689 RepID=UPI0009F21ECC|nr:uncharacterized protein LOC110093772 [Dendrobium catenatum]
MCRGFLWSKNDGKAGLHYASWDLLCRPENKGSRGLFSAVMKVGPLCAKFAWIFYSKPNTLLNLILGAKYGGDLWSGIMKKGCSSTWKIITMGANFLKNIVRWEVSNGNSIIWMQSSWILDRCIVSWPTFVNIQEESDIFLSSFISNGHWNQDKLRVVIGEQLLNLICEIPIRNDRISDTIELKCKFTGKSITALAFEDAMVHMEETAEWNWMKKLKLKPKIELFWWRLCIDAIPSNSFLMKRKINNFSGCPRGCGEDEDSSHLVGKCSKLRKVIALLNSWGFLVPIFNSLDECLEGLQTYVGNNSLSANIFCTTVSLVWRSKCKLVHGKVEDSDNYIAANAISLAVRSNFLNIQTENWDANQLWLFSTWHLPPPGWIKINIDAALMRNHSARIGGVARDEKGRFLIAFGNHSLHWDVSYLELLAIL